MYSGGSGTKQDPYLIATKADIELMFQNGEDEAYYKQIADIDMLGAEYSWQSNYKGAYDGQNYKISNVNFGAGIGGGFFGRVYKMADFDGDAQIKNVRLVTISVSGDSYCGCFAGSLSGVTVKNCHVESGEVTSLDGISFPSYAGGFVGSASESQILDCSFSGAIEAGYNSAGFVGNCWNSVISNCIVNTSVKHNNSQTAGLVSYLSHSSIIEKCKVQVIFEEIPGTWYSIRVGGIAVTCNGYIGQCTCDISISGNRSGYFGGIAATIQAIEWKGTQYNPIIENCYVHYNNTVFVNDNKHAYIGGIVSYIDAKDNCNATIRNCYVSGSIKIEIPENMYITNKVVVGGLLAFVNQSSGGTIILDNCFSCLEKIEIYSPGSYTTDQIGRIWGQIDDKYLPFLTSTCYANAEMLYNSETTFPNENKTLGGKDGEDIATTALREKGTYTSKNWDFMNVWDINPYYNNGLPYLHIENPTIIKIGPSNYFKLTKNNQQRTIKKIVSTFNFTGDEVTYTAGTGEEHETLKVENPYFTQEIANYVYSKLNGLTYVPYNMSWCCYPQLEPGDFILIETREGDILETFILSNKIILRGGLRADTKAQALSVQKSETPFKGTLTQKIEHIEKTRLVENKDYYGVRTGREFGLKIRREDGTAEVILNADKMEFLANGEKKIYFDTQEELYKFIGKLVASVVQSSVIIGSEIQGGSINIGDGTFTVDSSGNVVANSGVFRGNLDGAGGTFRGNLSAKDIIIGENNQDNGSINIRMEDYFITAKIAKIAIAGGTTITTLFIGKTTEEGSTPLNNIGRVDLLAGTLYVYNNIYANGSINAASGKIGGEDIATHTWVDNNYLDKLTAAALASKNYVDDAIAAHIAEYHAVQDV